MNKLRQLAFGLTVSAIFTSSAFAHHSAAAFNTGQEIKLTGPVVRYDYKNPHVYFTIQVKNADGSTVLKEVEAGAPSVLNPLGFTKESLKVGDVITVTGNPARSATDNTVLGKELYKADGTYYPLNIASRTAYNAKNDTATTIAGTWFSPFTEFTRVMGLAGRWPTTAQARGARATGATATTQKDCIPIGEPVLMFYPVATNITVQKDRVIIKVDWLDTERVVWLDGRKHPPATETTLHGHSTGRWEGETLVVETTNFKEHPMGISSSIPGSTQKKLTERFSLGADKKTLVYSGTVEDPVYLTGPGTWTGTWQYRPGMPDSNEKCDLETARKFLQQK
jgi:hypothetical protein